MRGEMGESDDFDSKSYKEYRDKQQAAHEAWLERKQERDAKIARGEKVGPEEPDPTVPKEIGVLGLLRGLVYALLLFLLAGKFFTGSFVWGYDGKWVHLKTYTPNVSAFVASSVSSMLTSRPAVGRRASLHGPDARAV